MRSMLHWLMAAVVAAFASMMAISVVGTRNLASTSRLTVRVPAAGRPGITFYQIPADLDIPATGGRPGALVLTYDGADWRAYSDRTAPYGCRLVPGQDPGTVLDPCGGGVWDTAGNRLKGPPRGLYRYAVSPDGPGRLKVNLLTVMREDRWPAWIGSYRVLPWGL